MQYEQRRYSTLAPIRTPPTSEDGSSVVSAVPPYHIAPPSAIQHGVVPDDKKQQQQQAPLSQSTPYGSPSSPNPSSFRPPLPSAPAVHRLAPTMDAPAVPSSPNMSDVESMMDTFPPYDDKSPQQVGFPSAPLADAPCQPQTQHNGSVLAEGSAPRYQGGQDVYVAEWRLKEERKQRAEEESREERSVERWRKEQELDRARELAQGRTSKPSSIDSSGASISSAGTRRPPSDSSSSTRRRPSQGMTAAESAAQHHFRLAQQHLEAAQRLAADSSLSLGIDRPSAARANSFEDRQPSSFDARGGGRPFDPYDDGQSSYADSAVDPEGDLHSPQSSYYEDASEFGESRYGSSYSSQPRVPPRRSMSLSSVSTSAPSYRSAAAPPLPPIPSLSASAGGTYPHTRYDDYRSSAPHQRQLPAYPPRQPSHLAPHPSRSDTMQSASDGSLASSYTFGGRRPSLTPPMEEGYVEVQQAGGWEERERRTRAPSPPRRASTIPRASSIRRGSSPPSPLPTALPHPSTFQQEPASLHSQTPPPEQQSQYWPPQQPQHRAYSPSGMSVSAQPPMHPYPSPSPSAQHRPTPPPQEHRPTPPPQHQAHYAPSPYPQAAPHMYGQPTSYILSPTGHPIPVYAAISAPPPPAPRQALAVHSQPLMYDHRLPYGATPSSAPPSAPPAQPQQLYAAPPMRTGASPTGILKKSPSNPNLLQSQPHAPSTPSSSPSHHPYAHQSAPTTRPSSTWSSSSSEGRNTPSILGNPYPAKLRSRMASLREKLTSSPHVRFQSPVPEVVQAEQDKEKAREREMGVQRRDDAVAAMNKTFGMLL